MNVVLLRRRKLGYTSCREIAAQSQQGIKVVRNDKPFPNNTDLVIRWGCTSNVPTKHVVNTSAAIHQVNNKLEFRKLLDEKGLCPKTYFTIKDAIKANKFPYIVRPSHHAQGRHLYVCNNEKELKAACAKHTHFYISEIINKIAEYRVCVAQGRAMWVANKVPANPNDIAWNVAKGGVFSNVRWNDWPLKAVKVAIEAFNLSSLDFGGVDIMADENNNVYVIEINSAPSLTSPYRQECMAKVFDFIVKNGKERISLIEEKGGSLKFIHPALNDKAKLVKKVPENVII